MKNKSFDCVDLKNKIQEQMYTESEGDWNKSRALIDKLVKQSSLSVLFKIHPKIKKTA
jgi:hypothetical protein